MCEMLNKDNLKSFEDRYNYDVSDYIEKKTVKGKRKNGTEYSFTLSYLSWAYAQKIAKIFDPNFRWLPVKNESGSLNHGGMVLIEMTFLGVTEQHYFPILDAGNKAIANPNAFDINTAQMRGMAKLFAMMSGFGLKLYTGEDIKDIDFTNTGENNKASEKSAKNPKRDGQIKFIKQHQKEYQSYITECLSKAEKETIEELDDKQIDFLKNNIAKKLGSRNKEGVA